ncbi:MAG: protein-export chaperone SecB [Rhodospirillaceae bacterium]|nr:protein-export chaperone SecB [Rhodospirillaceae bacterium]
MSEDQQPNGDEAGHEGEGGIPLNITHQYTKDLSFENPAAPGLFINAQTEPPNIDIDVRVEAQRLGDNTFEVVLHVQVNATAGSTTLFIAEIAYAAIAEIGEIPEEHLHPFIIIEVPRMIFPFARSILSGTISEGGFPPLLISPVDFVEMYRQTAKETPQTN